MKMLVLLTIVFAGTVIVSFARAVENPMACDCVNLFDELAEKIQMNHIAYHIEIKDMRNDEYRKHINKYRADAGRASVDKCIPILKEFITFYRDGHLYIGQSPKLTDEEINKLKIMRFLNCQNLNVVGVSF